MEIYVSTDIEANDPVPKPNSMLSFGSAAHTAAIELVGTFSANLETLPDAAADPKTAAWWKKHPEAWTACRQNHQARSEPTLWNRGLPTSEIPRSSPVWP